VPYAGDGPADCPFEEVHLPGAPGCERIGDPCPADGFPPDLPSTDVVFVRAGAPAGGDGTRASPFVDVVEALAVVPDGTTIAVAPGTYGRTRIDDRAVSIVGGCTDVLFDTDEPFPTIEIASSNVTIRNLSVTGAHEGITVRDGSLDARDVIIHDVRQTSLNAIRGRITASHLKMLRSDDTGISLANDSTMELDHFAVIDARNDSIRTADSQATMSDGVVVRSDEGQHFFAAQTGGAIFERVAFFGSGAILGINAPTIELRDVVVEGPPADVDTVSGTIATFEGGDLTMNRVRIERSRTLSAAVADPGGVLTLTDVLVRDTLGAAGESAGHGIELGLGAQGTIERIWVERARSVGILAALANAHLDARDVTVVDTRPDDAGTFGRALQIQNTAMFVGTRIAARGNHEVAIVSAGDGTRVQLTHLLIEDTRERTCTACATAGVGLGAYVDGAIDLERFLIRDNALAGVQVANDGQIDLRDGEVASNPVGVNIQVPDYDVERLIDRVQFRNNGTNLDSSELPVPDPTVMR
jgi:hypothetical protein